MRATLALAAIAFVGVLPAHAAAAPTVEGAVYFERNADGERLVTPAHELKSGDTVVLLVRWNAAGDRDGFTVTTPVPAALAYQRESSDAVEVSVDGGRSWGHLGQSVLKGARPDEVTHLRWRIGARQAARGSGSFAYSAIVR